MIAVARGGDFIGPVLRPALTAPRIFLDSHVAQGKEAASEILFVSGDRSTFTTSDIFNRVEAKAGDRPQRPDFAPLIRGAESGGRVFHQPDLSLSGKGEQFGHLAHLPAVVYGHDRFGL